MKKKRAVITGIGLLTPLGNSPRTFYSNALAGTNKIGKVRKFNAASLPVSIGAEIDFTGEDLNLPAERLAEMPIVSRWAVLAARKAIADSGIELSNCSPFDSDVVIGMSTPSLNCIDSEYLSDNGCGMAKSPPATVILFNPASAAIQISHHLGLYGETVNVTTSCSSAASAIGYAARLIQHGESKCVITGGADEGVTPLFLGSLGNGTHLSHRNDDPLQASRPFDAERDGYVVSDAACIFVLEEYEHAAARSARIYCEIGGYGATSDATSAFKLGKSEEPSAIAMERAIQSAGKSPEEIDYYCALGVSVPWMDIRETRMLRRVFRDRARNIPVSSVKSMMGHPMGASGAIQAATCALAIHNQAIPPTINYRTRDPECDLDYVPNTARSHRVRNAMMYTIGNGGTNTSMLFTAC